MLPISQTSHYLIQSKIANLHEIVYQYQHAFSQKKKILFMQAVVLDPLHFVLMSSKIFVSNIPPKFTESDLKQMLQHADIPFMNTELTIQRSKRGKNTGDQSDRFAVLLFENDSVAQASLDAINALILTVDKQEVSLRATMYIPNFRQYLENPVSNLVATNLPLELATSDLKELFSEFGEVLSAQVIKPKDPNAKSSMGFVLFKTREEAEKAIEQANGKFLGPNKLYVLQYKTIQQRIEENKEILIQGLSPNTTEDDVKKMITDSLGGGMTDDDVFSGDITLKEPDLKGKQIQGEIKKYAIFTCVSKEISDQIIKEMKNYDGNDDNCNIMKKYSKGMLAYIKSEEQKHNREKYVDSESNISVYNIRPDVTEEQVKKFFSNFGEIVETSKPNREDVNTDIAHYNILFSNKDDAQKAISKAPNHEDASSIAINDKKLKCELYQPKKEIQSSKQRQPGAKKGTKGSVM